MNVGILLPGFSADEDDWAIPVQLNLVRELASCDDVHIVALRYPHRRDCYRVHGATVYSLGAGQVRGVGRLALWWKALRLLRELHQQKPFDVLHAMWADETGLIAAWAGRLLRIPVVVSVAGGELARLDDIGYGLQRGAISRWIVGQALFGADCVIVAGNYAGELIAKARYRVPASKVRTVVLGTDTALFCPGNEPPEERRLVHVASLVPVKDQAMLLRAVARIEGVTLDVIGVGPQRGRLEALVAQLGIRERVQFHGAVPHQELPRYYRRAALNVLTSRHEGLGMVTLEAGACGVPTIGTAVGMLPDYPALGVSVPVGDDAALVAAIDDLLANDERRAALGRSAYETVRDKFTIQETVRQFRAVYEELAKVSSI